MVEEPHQRKSVSNLRARRFLICAITAVVLSLTLWVVAENRAARRERAAFETLCAMGATGDDWVSLRELITGSPPIVELSIPDSIPAETAFAELVHLRNLEHLTLAYPSLNEEQLSTIQKIGLDSLSFEGAFPTDADVKKLTCLRGVLFLHLPKGNLSTDAKAELKSLFSSTTITFK